MPESVSRFTDLSTKVSSGAGRGRPIVFARTMLARLPLPSSLSPQAHIHPGADGCGRQLALVTDI